MQHIIVHGKNNLYSDLYLIILMIALELCWWWLLIEHSLCPRRHLYIPLCPRRPRCCCFPVSLIANRTFLVSRSLSLWVSRSSFIFPIVVVSLCPYRHLCPGVPVCNFSLSVAVVIYIPCVLVVIFVPVVICVLVSRSVISFWVSWSSFIFPVSRSSFVSRSFVDGDC